MGQEDYILREIQKISIMLLGILGKLKRMRGDDEKISDETFKKMIEEFEEEARLNLPEILALDKDDLKNELQEKLGFDSKNQELLADLLMEITFVNDINNQNYIKKALDIYIVVDKSSKVYDPVRIEKMENCRQILREGLHM